MSVFEKTLPEPGSQIDVYRISKLLGMGGCAAVYRAEESRMSRDVAIKIILPEAAESIPGLVDRFEREIELIKRLEHPNIVRLYNFGNSEGYIWMAMELVRGIELQDLLKKEGRLPPERAIAILLQVLSALAAAHKQQIIHRDLKPSNIMLTEQGAEEDVVKLLDFGIGKAIGEAESSAGKDITGVHGPSTGTPQYLAPELIKEDRLGTYSDVYAMGLIFFEMLVGHPAVSGNTLFEIIAAQVGAPVALPPWLKASPLGPIIDKALSKDPKLRYPSALEFYRALKTINPATVHVDDVWAGQAHNEHHQRKAKAAAKAQPKGDFSIGSSLGAFLNPPPEAAGTDDTIPITPNFSAFNDPSLPQIQSESNSTFGLPTPPGGQTAQPPPRRPSNPQQQQSTPNLRPNPGRPLSRQHDQARVRQLLVVFIAFLVVAIIIILVAMVLR